MLHRKKTYRRDYNNYNLYFTHKYLWCRYGMTSLEVLYGYRFKHPPNMIPFEMSFSA